ncbi:glycosyl hydrolase family 61-domain-containing protein [Bisporella sp. PMI_857]|nr:glycosyl hydrolase family 61-domain-containing protein [Bisporella sp. PMI_857]
MNDLLQHDLLTPPAVSTWLIYYSHNGKITCSGFLNWSVGTLLFCTFQVTRTKFQHIRRMELPKRFVSVFDKIFTMGELIITLALCFLGTAVAHGGVYWYDIDGTQYKGYLWNIFDSKGNPIPNPPAVPSIQRRWDLNPIEDPKSSNITCNFDGARTPTALHAPIKAGGNITAHWDQFMTNVWPDGWHHGDGPFLTYLAACPGTSCDGFDGSGKVWFKIDQLGLMPQAQDLRGPWWQSQLLKGTKGYTVTIPKNLKPGNYLLRTEIIMMASRPTQIYPECAQLTVTGEETGFPGEQFLVSFPGAYSVEDPGLAMSDWTVS